jgi:DNA repair exonuclease SbcCD ATPase subunit
MKLIRLQVNHFAAIGQVEIEFGPGLNVLYGPNDLGKSTVAESIRLALLLPHSSSHSQSYVAWTGGGDPAVELTFASEEQRIWRVRKQFGRTGSSQLQESRNGKDFEDVERGRGVDGKLREILGWGIPEPGGANAPKGLPDSFLARTLLSTQEDVSGILGSTLQGDLTSSGKEKIAAALQAIAQDPLFIELLKKIQERRDAAYTEKGARKTARGSIFKEAADRVNDARNERDRWQETVDASEGEESRLRNLTARRESKREKLANATAHHANLEMLARQTSDRSVYQERVREAESELKRIHKLRSDVETAEHRLTEMGRRAKDLDVAVEGAKQQDSQAQIRLAAARETARVEQSDPAFSDTQLLLRKNEVELALHKAEQNIQTILAAKRLADAALERDRDLREHKKAAKGAAQALAEAETREKQANGQLVHCDLLKKILEWQTASRQVKAAQDEATKRALLETRLRLASEERASLVAQRAAIVVPPDRSLALMRRLAEELAAARGALNVGLIATLTPDRSVELALRTDGKETTSLSTAQPHAIEANTEFELTIVGVATIRVQGGRREAQTKVAALEERWKHEVAPHLSAAGVNDLEGLAGKIEEARQLDATTKNREGDLRFLEEQLSPLSSVEAKLLEATEFAEALKRALGNVDFERLAAEVTALEPGAATKLARQSQQLSAVLEEARQKADQSRKDRAVAEERARHLEQALGSANASRDLALRPFPQGVDATLTAASAECDAHAKETRSLSATLASLQDKIAMRDKRLRTAEQAAQTELHQAATAIEAAQKKRESVIAERASEEGRLKELRNLRDATNLASAEDRLRQAKEQYELLPVPSRIVGKEEVIAVQSEVTALQSELGSLNDEFNQAKGALEHIGGAVARERLSEAIEVLELAERREKEIEADSEAWKLLLEQMKEADAAQASNLGIALTPAIADRFTALTQERYQNVKLNAQLETEGVVRAGTVRSALSLSLGTRDQLSTLFRLSLAEYLSAAVVLDDQLVQSDGPRMQWFQELLYEKAMLFQIIVLTCRPSDYLPSTALVPANGPVHLDMSEHPVRAVDLGRAIQRG